ncbi:MAG TPA: amino acid adenylation domain-containing protein, partial [Acidimicrobiales bacterium]|nr:amino acid adenylation domain-containing protein [Acidimicrobiales bacterium]
MLEFPFDRTRPAEQSDRGGHCRAVFEGGLVGRLEALSRGEETTMFMTLLAAFSALLARYSPQDEFVIGTPIANRNRVELEELIGFFANTLALRVDVGGNPSFRELLGRTREAALRAYANQELPFEKLVAELNPQRSLRHSPLFQVLFQFHEAGRDSHELPGLTLRRVELERRQAKFDLALTLAKTDEGLHVSFEYSTDLFEAATVERLLANFEVLLRGLVAEPDRAVSEVEILSPAERAQIDRWNETGSARPELGRCVQELFEEQVIRTPDAVAVEFGERSVSYAELNARANGLARRLCDAGAGRDVPVAICLERSLELPIAVLAVLKAGGAYAPLDPAYPAERLAFMLEDTGAPVLVTQRSLLDRLPERRAQVICVDDPSATGVQVVEPDLSLVGGPDDLAYVLFTSGSTGRPKGVAMPHAPLCNLLSWQRDHFSSSPSARTLQFASISFDVAFQELFSTWICGGTLVLVDEETRRDAESVLAAISERHVERIFLPYVALQQLAETALDRGMVPSSLREVITAGEALKVTSEIREFFAHLPECTLHNQYGPTESHVVTAFTLSGSPAAWPDRPPIGRPIANARVHLLDEHGQLVPVGVPGELHIGGEVLARRYLGPSELTAERFVADPFAEPGARLYRTGDQARLLADGNLEFVGRLDHQVKVRGYRVEPGEIEVQLTSHPAVRGAVVVALEDTGGDRRLIAYVAVPATASGDEIEAELKTYLGGVLPEFMVPSAIVVLEALPLSPNGKVDRSALPAATNARPEKGFVPVRSATEETVARVWSDVLGIEPIGATDNFFDL